MSGANDIANLFARFGGKPEHYQEIARADQARDSEARWPLLSSVGAQAAHPPAVQQGQPRPSSGPSPFARPETAPRMDGRTEPTVPWGAPPPAVDDAVFSAPLTPAATPEAPPAPAAPPLSQFIAPRPRGQGRPAPAVRAAAQTTPSAPTLNAFAGSGVSSSAGQSAPTAAIPAAQAAPGAAPMPGFASAAPAAPPASLSTFGQTSAAADAPPTPSAPSAQGNGVQALFERLARPAAAPTPEPAAPALSLFARLVRR